MTRPTSAKWLKAEELEPPRRIAAIARSRWLIQPDAGIASRNHDLLERTRTEVVGLQFGRHDSYATLPFFNARAGRCTLSLYATSERRMQIAIDHVQNA